MEIELPLAGLLASLSDATSPFDRREVGSTTLDRFGSKLRAAASFPFPADPAVRWLGLA
jgi:hypothetical protein